MATTRSLLSRFRTICSPAYRAFASRTSAVRPSPIPQLRPLVSVGEGLRPLIDCRDSPGRCFSTRSTTSSIQDPSPNWSNRPPKETILLDGCDFEHWLVVVEKPDEKLTRDEIIDSYLKTLAQVVGSEEEARMKIYSVSTKHYFAFGALVSEELSYKIKALPGVRWVLPDSYLDVRNKDYGGEPFIDGQAVPYDPKYHEEWVRNNARANARNGRQDRPRNSRNFGRRENMQREAPPMPNFQNAPPPPPAAPPLNSTLQMPSNAGAFPNHQGPNPQPGYGYQASPPPPAGGHGYQAGPPGGQGFQDGPPGNHGYQPGPPGNQGYQSGSPGGRGYQPGPHGGQGYQPGPPSGQGYQPGPPGSGGSQGYPAGPPRSSPMYPAGQPSSSAPYYGGNQTAHGGPPSGGGPSSSPGNFGSNSYANGGPPDQGNAGNRGYGFQAGAGACQGGNPMNGGGGRDIPGRDA